MKIILYHLLILGSISSFTLSMQKPDSRPKTTSNPSPFSNELKVSFAQAIYTGDVNLVKSYLQQAPQLAQQAIKLDYYNYEFPMLGHALNAHGQIQDSLEHVKIIEALLNAGADPNQLIKNHSPLTLYLQHGQPLKYRYQVVKALLDKGANPNFKDYHGFTPLMFASRIDDGTDIVNLLLNRGAHINTVNKEGNTALIIAAQPANADTVKRLLAVPSATDIRKKQKDTSYLGLLPVEIAQNVDKYNAINPNIIADPNIKNISGWTALDYAENSLATLKNISEDHWNNAIKQHKRNLQEIVNLLRPITQKKSLVPVTRPAPARQKM